MLRHLLFWLLPPITLYFPTYTYFRQFWVKSQRSITLNNSNTRNGRVHICHSTRCWKSHLASDNYDSRGHFKTKNRSKHYYCVQAALLDDTIGCSRSQHQLLFNICFEETTIISIQLHQFRSKCACFNPFTVIMFRPVFRTWDAPENHTSCPTRGGIFNSGVEWQIWTRPFRVWIVEGYGPLWFDPKLSEICVPGKIQSYGGKQPKKQVS